MSGEDLDGDDVPDLVTTTVNVHTRAWGGADESLLWEVDYTGGYKHAEGTGRLALTRDHDDDGVRDLVVGANETFLDADRGSDGPLRADRQGLEALQQAAARPGPGGMVGGADVASLGDLDGDGLEELAVWEPVPQRLQLRDGADLHVLWKVDVTSLERPE